MTRLLARFFDEVDALALCSLAALALAALLLAAVVTPLERRAQSLEREVARAAREAPAQGFTRVGAASPEASIAAFYRYFERAENTVEWLAKLQGMARAAGLELRSADYRLAESRQRLRRYQLTLPVSGTYTQVRAFLESALQAIPVLSLDQVSFRRRSANETRVEAEIVLTLHLLRK